MNLTERINNDIKEAMKAREQKRLAALRDIKSKFLLEQTKGGNAEMDEGTGLKILDKLYKQRIEAAELYKGQNRDDLYQEEMDQAEVIKAYLPQALSEDEVRNIVASIISDTGASGMADMGKVMGLASQKMAGRADGKFISQIVKEILTA
ncbi:MAG: GatB/YqeY domain-containing protein [Flavobacteriales bacterium]|nr:GatB/YqeY domain-containing protein [Flavobacteriales bacterium]